MKTEPRLKNSRKKTSLGIVKTKENAFMDVIREEIVRAEEITLEEETGTEIF